MNDWCEHDWIPQPDGSVECSICGATCRPRYSRFHSGGVEGHAQKFVMQSWKGATVATNSREILIRVAPGTTEVAHAESLSKPQAARLSHGLHSRNQARPAVN